MPAAALRALLTHAIDYAGLFPPAGLALAPALENYARYRQAEERWMLGAFILPLAKFAAARALLAEFDAGHSFQISALGPKDAGADDLADTLEKAGATIEGFSAAQVTQFEMPLPAGATPRSLGNLRVFWESPPADAPTAIQALAGSGAGCKLRTGGVTADAFPTDAQIAAALVAAARQQVPIKFTAGLHHPVKKFHESVGTKMPGFLNVLGAGVLAAEHRWDEPQTAEMLADEEAGSFAFDDARFRWRDWEITTAQIALRRQLVTSLGSCSFDEPRDDLRALGLL